MLGLLLLYFIGKKFYDLAGKHGKHQWAFAIVGVIGYYAFGFLLGFTIGYLIGLSAPEILIGMSDIELTLLEIGINLLSVILFYTILRKYWEKKGLEVKASDGILDAESFDDL